MVKEFNALKEEERELLLKAPAMVTIFIAGADDDIDHLEKQEAERLAKFKGISGDPILLQYYKLVHQNFQKDIEDLIRDYPKMAELRNPIIEKQLEMLNNILIKLPRDYAIALYDSLKKFAKDVAESSGGFLGFLTVGPEEKDLIELPMIRNPRTY